MYNRVDNLLLGGAAAMGLALTLYAWYPGYMTFDAAYQYWQVRHFEFTTHHPPLMALIWYHLSLMTGRPIVQTCNIAGGATIPAKPLCWATSSLR